jgi:hypothetical protein
MAAVSFSPLPCRWDCHKASAADSRCRRPLSRRPLREFIQDSNAFFPVSDVDGWTGRCPEVAWKISGQLTPAKQQFLDSVVIGS